MYKIYLSKNKILVVLISLFVLLISDSCASKKQMADRDTQIWRYELECAGNSANGNYLVKVWSYSQKPTIAVEQCKKNAVHGVLFKGFPAKSDCYGNAALAVNQPGLAYEKEDFFKLFFADGGDYMKYVSVTKGTYEQIKIGKEYKIGVVVSVSKNMLRKDLEAAGVLKRLNDGF